MFLYIRSQVISSDFNIFKPGVCQLQAALTWFLKIVSVQMSVCVFVCVSAPEVINN